MKDRQNLKAQLDVNKFRINLDDIMPLSKKQTCVIKIVK